MILTKGTRYYSFCTNNHFLLNSTLFVDEKRYCNTYNSVQRIRNISDEICKENKQNKGISRDGYFYERTLKSVVKGYIDKAISITFKTQRFIMN